MRNQQGSQRSHPRKGYVCMGLTFSLEEGDFCEANTVFPVDSKYAKMLYALTRSGPRSVNSLAAFKVGTESIIPTVQQVSNLQKEIGTKVQRVLQSEPFEWNGSTYEFRIAVRMVVLALKTGKVWELDCKNVYFNTDSLGVIPELWAKLTEFPFSFSLDLCSSS